MNISSRTIGRYAVSGACGVAAGIASIAMVAAVVGSAAASPARPTVPTPTSPPAQGQVVEHPCFDVPHVWNESVNGPVPVCYSIVP
jgi:hypothetical protein